MPQLSSSTESTDTGMHPLAQVVEGGCCVGCGACAVASQGSMRINLTRKGTYEAAPLRDWDDVDPRVAEVCGFSDRSANEDELSLALFPGAERHPGIGAHRLVVAGAVNDPALRANATSGGLTSWILVQLMERGIVQAVVHVAAEIDRDGATYSRYRISRSVDQVLERQKSRYHVQTLAAVLEAVRTIDGPVAVVGVPCFVKAVQLLRRNDPWWHDKVRFTVSLFCGHQKSARFTDYLAWTNGIEPSAITEIDYRAKVEGRPANRYAVTVGSQDRSVTTGVEQIPMADWGIGLFKLGACDYCDDVAGETADLSCGDAWLPPFMSEWRGTNVAIARSELAVELLEAGRSTGALELWDWTAEQAAQSQAAGLRHRREGLGVRLAIRQRDGKWAPRKRVSPNPDAIDTDFGRKMAVREEIAQRSHEAFAAAQDAGELALFHREMQPLVKRYHGSTTRTVGWKAAAWVLHRTPAPIERVLRRLTGGRRFS